MQAAAEVSGLLPRSVPIPEDSHRFVQNASRAVN